MAGQQLSSIYHLVDVLLKEAKVSGRERDESRASLCRRVKHQLVLPLVSFKA